MRPDNDPANHRKVGRAGPEDVVPHCPLALISSSASTTSSAPKCRPAPGTWCPTALQPLFLRRGAPRPPPQNADRPRGRGASLPSSPYFFVEEHHVLHSKVPGSPGGVVPHCPPALISSSRSTTSGSPFSRPGRGRGASSLASPYSFVRRHHVRRLKHSAGFACGRILQNLDYSR